MSHRVETIALPTMRPGTQRLLKVHRFGAAGARPKAYLQAALHADEAPGMLAAHHLMSLLRKADARGEIKGEVVLVPVANPIGVGQLGAGDFSHAWPDLSEGLGGAVEQKLSADASANVRVIRAALADRIAVMRNKDEFSALQQILMGFAYDSDIVLDLQCDDEALPYVYVMSRHERVGSGLAAEIGAAACLLCDDPGFGGFEETFSLPWIRMHEEMRGRFPIPADCFAATVELRGRYDVSDDLAKADADALFRFLQRRKVVAGRPDSPASACKAVNLRYVDMVEAPAAGIVSYKAELGDRVQSGSLVAEIIDPLAGDPASSRTPVRARTDGMVLTRCLNKLVSPADAIMMIVP